MSIHFSKNKINKISITELTFLSNLGVFIVQKQPFNTGYNKKGVPLNDL